MYKLLSLACVFVVLLSFNSRGTQLVADSALRHRADSLKTIADTSSGFTRLDAYCGLFAIYYQPQPAIGREYAQLIQQYANGPNQKGYRFMSFMYMGYCFRNEGNLDSAHFCFEQALEYSRENNLLPNEALALSVLADTYILVGDYVTSLKYTKKGHELALQSNDSGAMVITNATLARGYFGIDEDELALMHLKKAAELAIIHDKEYYGGVLNNIGEYFNEKDIYDSAIVYLNLAYRATPDYNYAIRGGTLINIALSYLYAGAHKETIMHYLNSAKYNLDFANSGSRYGNYYRAMGKLFQRECMLDEALDSYQKSLDYSYPIQYHSIIQENLLDMAKIYEIKKEYEKAYLLLAQHKAISDSIAEEEQIALIKNMEYQKSIAKENYNNELLSKELTIKNRDIRVLFVSGLAILIVLMALLYLYVITRRKNKVLFDKIQQQAIQAVKEDSLIKFGESQIEKTDLLNDETRSIIKQNLQKWIANNKYLEAVTISELSKKLKTNQKYLSIVIHEEYGANFTDFLNDLRMSYALKELQINKTIRKYSNEHLSQHFGFNSRSTFHSVFKQHTGLTPSYYISRLN